MQNPAPSVSVLAAAEPAHVVQTEQVRVTLLAHAPQGVAPGRPFWLGLQFAHQPHWHTYWKNAGDSGQPPELHWQLPPGLTAGAIQWPLPKKIPVVNLANYGFEGTVLLLVPVTVAPDFKPTGDALSVRLQASWLVCREECVPQDGNFILGVAAQQSTASHATEFEAALAAQPQPLAGTAQISLQGQSLQVRVSGLPAAWQGRPVAFFPEVTDVIETAAPIVAAWDGANWSAQVPLARQRGASPAELPFWLVADLDGGRRQGVSARATVQGQWPVPPGSAAAALRPVVQTPGADWGVLGAVLGALVGGMILNLMPCVFPVLAIKVVGFARHAQDLRAHRLAGLAYSAGVVVSFMALGLLLMALRGAGEQLGWGFQLQSPGVVAALATLFTLIALNLMGWFELGSVLPGGLAAVQLRHPVADAALSGVLAVAVASPCTAPFMGASLGLALTWPTAQALAVFAALGVGMALPYFAAAFWPGVARRLPRPGPWMGVLRQALAFPMWATVVWLIWVLGQQVGVDGAAAAMVGLLLLAALLWSLRLTGRLRTGVVWVLLVGLLAWLSGPGRLVWTEAPVEAGAVGSASGRGVSKGVRWQAWSPTAVQAELGAGRAVFVDFTAAWCVTCQVNKKTTLTAAAVLADFDARGVTLLRADWTRRDPVITTALAELGRSGVPVYALYVPGRAPLVLSELITPADVHRALATLATPV